MDPVRENRLLKKRIISLENEIMALKTELPDPFAKVYGIKNILKAVNISHYMFHKHRKSMARCGAIGYEFAPKNCLKRCVGYPYLIMLYFRSLYLNQVDKEGVNPTYAKVGQHKRIQNQSTQ